jgi:hypothetical protein
MATVMDVVDRVTSGIVTKQEKAIRLHNYVRDNIKFGFNRYFDAGSPDYTLSCGAGHCNPKSRLMVALFQAAGLEAFQHFVVIPRDILKGVIPSNSWWIIPAELSHSYVEVKVDGIWCEIDSFIVDTPLLKAAQARLASEGRTIGYGVRIDSTNQWDGQNRAFSQFDSEMMIEDHGRIDDLESYFRSRKYRHKILGVRFNTTFNLMGDRMVSQFNSQIDQIRQQDDDFL